KAAAAPAHEANPVAPLPISMAQKKHKSEKSKQKQGKSKKSEKGKHHKSRDLATKLTDSKKEMPWLTPSMSVAVQIMTTTMTTTTIMGTTTTTTTTTTMTTITTITMTTTTTITIVEHRYPVVLVLDLTRVAKNRGMLVVFVCRMITAQKWVGSFSILKPESSMIRRTVQPP
ncbi:hypothetical protein MPER_03380, partial [Moniliophthora perniciosa FA553]